MSGRLGSRVLISIGVMTATAMQVLDTTIVNVALPDIQGELSATPDSVSWVLTSYLISSAVVMPMTGYFTDRLGQRNHLLISILGFVATSVLCGAAASLPQLVAFRILQGVFGAALVPLSQSLMVQSFPAHERGRAMAIWGIGVMLGPILGPTLGGYITEYFNWRWTFYVNVPIGAFSLALCFLSVPDSERRERTLDWLGVGLIVLAVGGLQLVLDRGNHEGWFTSDMILVTTLVSAAGFAGFLAHALREPSRSIFDVRLFRDRNFATSCTLILTMMLGMYGALVLQPFLLEDLLGYPTATAGVVMAGRGLGSMGGMWVAGRLINHAGPRPLMVVGVLVAALGSWVMTWYNLSIDMWWVLWPMILQGVGLGLLFVPLGTIAYLTLPPRYSAEAAGMFSLARSVGSAVGVSIAATILSRHSQIAWQRLGAHLEPFRGKVHEYTGRLGLSPTEPEGAAMLAREVAHQAQMIALLDALTLIFWFILCGLPLVLLVKASKADLQRPSEVVEADEADSGGQPEGARGPDGEAAGGARPRPAANAVE